MCGIAGYKGVGNEAYLKTAAERLSHRGPDEQKYEVAGDVGFAFARLAIQDLSPRGSQPMWNTAGTIGIVFNGEIYNVSELRSDLVAKGYSFRGRSDTEVLIALYEEYGTDCFAKTNGMFGLAINDTRSNILILARDRFGKKPLYWTQQSGALVFASELKALLPHPSVRRELDREALSKYLALEYVPTPLSIFKNIFKLEPGTFLTFKEGTITKQVFWQPPQSISGISFEEAKGRLDTLLGESVNRRRISDVPLGVFLSGGIDSSAITYYAQQQVGKSLKTFSIGFQEASFDESKYARDVATFLGTEHQEHIVSEADARGVIQGALQMMLDEPMADASIIPTALLSAFTRQEVTVALGGDGADELLLGYPTFEAERYAAFAHRIPKSILQPVVGVLEKMDGNESYFSVAFKAQKFLEGLGGNPAYQHQRWLGAFSETDLQNMLPGTQSNPYAHIDAILSVVSSYSRMNQLSYEYLRTYLMDAVLVKVDRASMAHSLEVRAPFLDFQVVDFLLALPAEYKMRGKTGKYLLREVLRGKVPDHVIDRKKHGFAIPLSKWLKNELQPWAESLLGTERIKRQGIFNPELVQKIWNEHQSGTRDHRKELWTLLVFQMWYDTWYS